MSTELLIREHLESLADKVVLTPAGLDVVVKRVRRGRMMWGLAVAAVLVATVGVVTIASMPPRQDSVAAPSSSVGAGSDSSWSRVVVAPDGGAVIQIIASRNGGFVLLTENQRWFQSEDGDTWIELEPVGFGQGARIQMITNAGDRLIAAGTSIGGDPLVATSLDGVVWEGALPGKAGDWIPVSIAVVDDTVLVPFINSSFDSVVYRFTVADLWTVAPPPEPGSQVLTIGVLSGEFVAQVMDAPEGSKHRDYRSADGLDWQPRNPIPSIQVNMPLTHSIIEGPGGWYLVSSLTGDGEQLMRSRDGDMWEPAIDTAFEFGPPSLVAGEYGIIAALPTNYDPGSGAIVTILYSPDGDSWTVEDLGPDFYESSRQVMLASNQRRIVAGGRTFEGGTPRGTARTEVWVTDR